MKIENVNYKLNTYREKNRYEIIIKWEDKLEFLNILGLLLISKTVTTDKS